MSFLGFGKNDSSDTFMNPLYASWVGSALRTLLPYAAGMVGAGGATFADNDIEKLASVLVTIGMLAWSMYQKVQDKRVQNQLAAKAQTTVQQAKAEVASPFVATPPASTPENIVPRPSVPPSV